MKGFIRSALLTMAVGIHSSAYADFLPPNDLHLQKLKTSSNIDEETFEAVVTEIADIYTPIVEGHRATFELKTLWDDDVVNASAVQTKRYGETYWVVNIYGGLARRPEITRDGLSLVVCHEVGHHVAGYPFKSRWAGSEGQSDYFSSQECARKLWANDHRVNAAASKKISKVGRELCDSAWQAQADQNLCYRTLLASQSLANLLGSFESITPDFSTPESAAVDRTDVNHPRAQCRLDTLVAGAVCTRDFDEDLIPGKTMFGGRNSKSAERAAQRVSCTRASNFTEGVRPNCWFAPLIAED